MPRIVWQGEDLGEFTAPTLKEARTIKKTFGLRIVEFGEAVEDGDPDAWAALLHIMYTRAGKSVRWQDIDGGIDQLEMVPTEDEKRDRAAKQADVVNPAVRGILDELGVDVDEEETRAIVLRHLEAAQERQGNAPSPAPPGPET